jgi:hypothetical protein
MKKTLIVLSIAATFAACTKSSKPAPKTTTAYMVKVIEVDIDENSVTETPFKTVKITE